MSTINKTYLDLNGLTHYDEKIKEYIGAGGTSNYNDLINKPSINGVTLSGNITASDLGLQEELTFDNVPTDGSNNPVKSDGIYDSEKDIYVVMGKMGAKNLLPYPYKETTQTVNGITFTDNGDGTITANGTATGDAGITLYQSGVSLLKSGRYILSGCPEGGGTNIYKIQAAKNDWTFGGADFGNGVILNITNESTQQIQFIRILVSSGKTVSNLTFNPMIRLASDTDDTYEQYAKTNKQLTDEIATKTDKLTNTDSFYGTCSTAADVAEKVVTLVDAGNFSLRSGVTVTVKFSATNTAQNPTINVNNTGARSVWYNTASITTASLASAGTANRPIRYMYDGTYWVWIGQSIDNNTVYSAMSTSELTTGTAKTQRTVRADYLKAGINSLIDTKIAGKADASDVTALAGRVTNVQVSATQPTGQVTGDIWIKLTT